MDIQVDFDSICLDLQGIQRYGEVGLAEGRFLGEKSLAGFSRLFTA